ncbi:phosphoribosylanthranilate isomerase, partial [Pseudomonas aeruginosa]|uniref:phosphoribosylanthranilate isomerase n=1 Tax=Pseudomonas aeruginosa TaxID=287 RepID=UPI002095A6A8
VQIVGVFAEPVDKSLMDHAVTYAELDVIQIHGATPERVDMLRRFSGVETWAAIPVRTRADLDASRAYAQAADRLLYDAKTPPGSTLPGGMGVRFDWTLLDGFRPPLPWALSGGLDPGNVADAIRRTGAPIVDVSSGVESAPGAKDAG